MLYEIKRILTGKAMIVLFALLIILPILIAVSSASNSGGGGFSVDSIGYGYGSNGTYNVSVYLYDFQYGNPIQGTQVNIHTGTSVIQGTTGSNGYVNETLHNITRSEAGNLTYEYNVTQYGTSTLYDYRINVLQDPNDTYFTSSTFKNIVNNTVVSQTNYYPRLSIDPMSVKGYPNRLTFGLHFNPGGLIKVPPLYVYYKPLSNQTGTTPQGGVVFGSQELIYSNISSANRTLQNSAFISSTYLLNESQLHYLGRYQGTPFIPVNTEKLAANRTTTRYLFEVFSPNGTELAYMVIQLVNSYSGSHVSSIFNSDELPMLGIFVPLMAVLSGFNTLGKDKVEGSLNYVVVRPITRTNLIASRFFSNTMAIFIPAAVSVGISSAVYHFYLGAYIPSGTIYLSLWAIAVMATGFTGLVYLASSMIKSLGRLVGVSIGIFLIMDLFWSFPGFPIIPAIVTSTLPYSSLGYALAYVAMDYLTPSGFINLVSYLGYGNTSQPIFLGNFKPYQVGITPAAIIAIGLVWTIIPIVLSIIRFSRYD